MNTKDHKVIMGPHLATIKLREWKRLTEGKSSDPPVTDEECTEIAGVDCGQDQPGRNYVASALTYVLKHHGRTWYRIRGAGAIKCAGVTDHMMLADKSQRHTNRTAKTAMRRLQTVKFDDCTDDERKTLLTKQAVLGSLVLFSDGKMTKKLEARNIVAPLTEQKLLEVWKNA